MKQKNKVSIIFNLYLIFIKIAEIKTLEIDYLTQIQCYRNSTLDIDAFVFHQGMTQWYHALIVRALRRVLKKEYGVEQVLNSAKNFINYYLEKENPDEYVHLIWYCITGTRFEEIEKKL